MAATRVAGPPDLMNSEQQRQAAYVMDILQNHHWIFQLDQGDAIASKPPLFTWLAALASLLFNNVEPWGMRSIAFLATAASACLIHHLANKRWGSRAAFFAASGYLLCTPISKQLWLARMDSLFPLTIALGAVAALHAWETGRGWLLFWLAAAASTLTKTPLGVLLSAVGLLAIGWERRSTPPVPSAPTPPKNHWLRKQLPGIALFVLITLGWFLAACFYLGPWAVYHELIIEEFLAQSLQTRKGLFPGENFYASPSMILIRFLPWSIPLCTGIWRIIRQPDPNPAKRRFERFLVCWTIGGLIPFSLSPHQRGDLLLPLYIPAALLAGNELARWFSKISHRAFMALAAAIIVLGLGALTYRYEIEDQHEDYVKSTLEVRNVAEFIKSKVPSDFPLTHVDDPFALCVYLNTMRPLYYGPDRDTQATFDDDLALYYDYPAAAQLLQSSAAVYECVSDAGSIESHLPPGSPLFELTDPNDWPHILSNRPTFAADPHTALGVGPLKIELRELKLLHASATDFTLTGHGSIQITNNSNTPRPIHVAIDSATQNVTLQPNQVWEWIVR